MWEKQKNGTVSFILGLPHFYRQWPKMFGICKHWNVGYVNLEVAKHSRNETDKSHYGHTKIIQVSMMRNDLAAFLTKSLT